MSGKLNIPPEAATVVDAYPGTSDTVPTPEVEDPTVGLRMRSMGELPNIEVPTRAQKELEDSDPDVSKDAETTAPRIGEYALIARFPSSHTAEVFLGYKVANFGFLRRAVVKWTDSKRPDYGRVRQSILDEARAISFLSHPNIVTALDVGDEDKGTYLAVEYVAGTDLRRVLTELQKRNIYLSWEYACYISCELLRGLDHAHRALGPQGTRLNIVHRDVNPSNVLISETGHVKLTDFGTVLMEGRMQDQTAPGMVKGKVRYLAPEYIANQICTAQVDVYGVGVMLFEMLTGAPCFSGLNNVTTMLHIVREGLPYHQLEAMQFPQALIEIVRRATARDPNYRYSSAYEMCNALEEWMAHSGLFVSPSRLAGYLHGHSLYI